MSEDKCSLENLRLEYSEVNNNCRHYSNLRFAAFSVYFAILGGVASVAFGIIEVKSQSSVNILLWARIAGLIFTTVFFSYDVLCELNRRHFGNVAKKLEEELGYRQFRTRKFRFPRGYYFTWGMYALLIIFWLYVIYRRA
jgi:hypothetical protein